MNQSLEKLQKAHQSAAQKLSAAVNQEFPVGQPVTFTALDGQERLTGKIAAKATPSRPTWLKVFVGRANMPNCVCAKYRQMQRA